MKPLHLSIKRAFYRLFCPCTFWKHCNVMLSFQGEYNSPMAIFSDVFILRENAMHGPVKKNLLVNALTLLQDRPNWGRADPREAEDQGHLRRCGRNIQADGVHIKSNITWLTIHKMHKNAGMFIRIKIRMDPYSFFLTDPVLESRSVSRKKKLKNKNRKNARICTSVIFLK